MSKELDARVAEKVMNLKKSSGGHTTNNNELRKIAQEDNEFLNKQFQIYFENPTIRPINSASIFL